MDTKRKNYPQFSMGAKVKQSWHKHMVTDFVGRDAPSSTHYSPTRDNLKLKTENQLGKIGKDGKFHIPGHIIKLRSDMPC